MSKVADVDTAIWDDEDFLALSPVSRAVYMWSFTNGRVGMSGLYKVGRRAMQLETGWDERQIADALAELERERFVFFDGRVVFVRTRVKRLRMKSENIAKSILKDLEKLGDHEFVALFWEQNQREHWLVDARDKEIAKGSIEPSKEPLEGLGTSNGGVRSRSRSIKEGGVGETGPPAADDYPDDLPPELRPAADVVVETLQRVATTKGSKPPTLAAVGRTIASFPDHDHRKVVSEFEHYWCHGAGQSTNRKDLVLTYRRRLEQVTPGSPSLAAVPNGAGSGESIADLVARANSAGSPS